MEEKYGKGRGLLDYNTDLDDQEETDSSDEEEDDRGVLASGMLDEEYLETLRAIKERHPRVYDKTTKFYSSTDNMSHEPDGVINKETPVFLRDYHRSNLLNGISEKYETEQAPSYENEQQQLKQALVKQIQAAIDDDGDRKPLDTSENDQDMFVVRKPLAPERPDVTISAADVEQADRDPDGFLARFMTGRAWVSNEATGLHPFESDDEEDDRKAEEFEEAYNMRFENPETANEKITTHARDIAAKYSVRQEPKSRRKRAREVEISHREEAKASHLEEKQMLRKLRMEEVEQKLDQIRDAVGMGGMDVNLEDWSKILTEDWDTAAWELEMQRRFGESYYAAKDHAMDGNVDDEKTTRPRWDTDIDITDIVPGFNAEKETRLSLSDGNDDSGRDFGLEEPDKPNNGRRKQKDREQRRKLQKLVKEKVDLELALEGRSNDGPSRFKYRETSPLSYGLTSYDILRSSDAQLNQYAGLKKYASFRDPQKRQKDVKRLGKKARLRQWRKDTFGTEQTEPKTLQDIVVDVQASQARERGDQIKTISHGGQEGLSYQGLKKKRSRREEQV